MYTVIWVLFCYKKKKTKTKTKPHDIYLLLSMIQRFRCWSIRMSIKSEVHMDGLRYFVVCLQYFEFYFIKKKTTKLKLNLHWIDVVYQSLLLSLSLFGIFTSIELCSWIVSMQVNWQTEISVYGFLSLTVTNIHILECIILVKLRVTLSNFDINLITLFYFV